jgi:hypothetical protein
MIQTQIQNWRERCINLEVGAAVQFQPGPMPTVLCQVRAPNPPIQVGGVFGKVCNQTKPHHWSKPAPLAGYPDLFLTLYPTNHIHIIDTQYCVCMYDLLLPRNLIPLNFGSSAIHGI